MLLLNPGKGSAWKVPHCAWEWRGRAVGDSRVWGAAGWKAVAPLDKHLTSSIVFTNYEHISTNVTAATELWGLDVTNKQDGILLICAWSVTPLSSCLAETLSPCSTTLHSHSSSRSIRSVTLLRLFLNRSVCHPVGRKKTVVWALSASAAVGNG